MAGLKPIAPSKVINILEKHGFRKVRSRKHTTFKKTHSSGKILTTWVPHGDKVTVFVLKYIIKQTEIPKEEFL